MKPIKPIKIPLKPRMDVKITSINLDNLDDIHQQIHL